MKILERAFWIGLLTGMVYWFWRYISPRHSTLVLENRVVVVTGASSGLGQALAVAFARRGARVVLVGRQPERLEVVHREIEPYATAVLTIVADITRYEERQRVIDETLSAFSGIDVLVNGAGIAVGGLLPDHSPEQIQDIIDTNLTSAIVLTRDVLSLAMLPQNHGSIVNIGSGMGRTGVPAFSPYVASKYGLSGFSDSLRRELAGTGIQVMLVLPGWVRSGIVTFDVEQAIRFFRTYAVDTAETVAEEIVEGLVQGRNELVLGGWFERLGLKIERYAPWLATRYWVWMKNNTPWVSMARKID
ncbi:MAG: SDR family NAD(P)-dependent oxidoreductase [Chloroflexi bacterium]|nr:SDR family NAD(P)-dependent oxidoreductase [Chloroflexota bacterium]